MINRKEYNCDCDLEHKNKKETPDKIVIKCSECKDKSVWKECPKCGESKTYIYYEPGGKCIKCEYKNIPIN